MQHTTTVRHEYRVSYPDGAQPSTTFTTFHDAYNAASKFAEDGAFLETRAIVVTEVVGPWVPRV